MRKRDIRQQRRESARMWPALESPVVHDHDDEPYECDCREPEDNDEGVCMECGLPINYRSQRQRAERDEQRNEHG